MKKKIELPCYGIVVEIENGAGSITDDLHETIRYDPDNLMRNGSEEWDGPEDITWKEGFNNMIDGITSLILAHACAGIDITTAAYIEGIETSVQACEQYA